MPLIKSTLHQPAMLGGSPAFKARVPLIFPAGYSLNGDFSAVDAIVANVAQTGKSRASEQRYVAKILPGVEPRFSSFRSTLQERIAGFLELDILSTSVISVNSGTNALRAALRCVRVTQKNKGNEIIVPQITVGATVEAVIAEGFDPVFVEVDKDTWLLSADATERSTSNKTVGIITVDWLGTQTDLRPFRRLADMHEISLISDSAQSFGSSNGKPPSIDLAHATIYSLGYPKVFTGAGSGGLIICPTAWEDLLKSDATGVLRHSTLDETNAFLCLRALDSLPKALEVRRAAGKLYRQLLAGVPGITFQRIPNGLATNHYQVSFTVDAEAFGLSAEQLCKSIEAENVSCSVSRMPCVADNPKFASYGRAEGDLAHSRLLAVSSVTLPISNVIHADTVKIICGSIQLIQRKSPIILNTLHLGSAATLSSGSTDATDIESKLRQHLVIPVFDGISINSKILVPHNYLCNRRVSVDELLSRFELRKQWTRGSRIIGDLLVDAVIGTLIILAPEDLEKPSDSGTPIALEQSGSSANVALIPGADGKLMVRKSAVGDGVDGNGAPWLRRQWYFLRNSRAVAKTSMFVVPADHSDEMGHFRLTLPYVPSYTFGDLAFANVGADSLVSAMVNMLGKMATSVWLESHEEADSGYIQKAHFDRMKRRLEIARVKDRVLDKLLNQQTVKLNGRQLLGFEAAVTKLETHPEVAKIAPTILSEIHGDLNIHNILSRLDHKDGEDVALIDPRGVPLLDGESARGFECGDYCYDISKVLFSINGFSEIRRNLFNHSVEGDAHSLRIQQHPGSDTMSGAAHQFIAKIASNRIMKQWIEKVEPQGVRSFELRVKIGEAAHFVADCACALGRGTHREVVPLFLLGLGKLNDVIELLEGDVQLFAGKVGPQPGTECQLESADYGVVMIQNTLFETMSSNKKWPYDVLEVSLKAESASTAQKLLHGMVGTYLPEGTLVLLSTDPIGHRDRASPCLVLIHPSNGVRGQTHMLASATRRTTAFFRDNGYSQSAIERLKIVHISSTGSSSRSQFFARDNDKLLSPGSFGISPLHLAVMQSTQLPFPNPGRWVVENDSFFLLSRPLVMSGNHMCLLVIERTTSNSNSPWRICLDDAEKIDGLFVAKSFRRIEARETGDKLLRTTTGIFIPHQLSERVSRQEDDYASRTSPLLVDLVLPSFMERTSWIDLCHEQGYGQRSHLVWQNAKSFTKTSGLVELANGGKETAFYHFGSNREYCDLLASICNDARLNSLAYAGAAVQWRQRIKLK